MEIKILFVDDDLNILAGLKRTLYPLRNNWTIHFSSSGKEALKILESNEIDVVVSDIIMPGMNGSELLEIVSIKYPGIIRIILSGHLDHKIALKSSKLAHQFFAKPCDPNKLTAKIEEMFFFGKNIANEKIFNSVTGLSILPSLPQIYYQLESEINSENTSLQRVVKIISKDITMTAKILQLCNSAFFSLRTNVVDLFQAVNLLGFNVIKSLVLYVKVFSSIHNEELKNSIEEIWNHSQNVANISKKIAEFYSYDKNIIESSYIAGILHDIGKILLLEIIIKCPDFKQYRNDFSFNVTRENEIFGTDHAKLGAYLLALWGLPKIIIESVSMHHSKFNLTSLNREFSIGLAVSLADKLSHEPDFNYENFFSITSVEEFNKIFLNIEVNMNKKVSLVNYENPLFGY